MIFVLLSIFPVNYLYFNNKTNFPVSSSKAIDTPHRYTTVILHVGVALACDVQVGDIWKRVIHAAP